MVKLICLTLMVLSHAAEVATPEAGAPTATLKPGAASVRENLCKLYAGGLNYHIVPENRAEEICKVKPTPEMRAAYAKLSADRAASIIHWDKNGLCKEYAIKDGAKVVSDARVVTNQKVDFDKCRYWAGSSYTWDKHGYCIEWADRDIVPGQDGIATGVAVRPADPAPAELCRVLHGSSFHFNKYGQCTEYSDPQVKTEKNVVTGAQVVVRDGVDLPKERCRAK